MYAHVRRLMAMAISHHQLRQRKRLMEDALGIGPPVWAGGMTSVLPDLAGRLVG